VSTEGLPVCRVGELDEPEANPRWLVEQLWSRAAVGFIGGAPKLGKTWLGLDLALSVATATACLDRFEVREPGEVLLYLAEDHPTLVRQRLAGLCRHRGLEIEHVPVHVITAPSLRLDLEQDRQRLTGTVESIQPRLLVLDPLVRLHRRDENHAGDVAELLAFLRELQRAHDLAVLVVHHMRKGGAGQAGQALRGSGDFHAWTDSALYLRSQRDRLLLSAEHRAAPASESFELRLCSASDGFGTHLEIVADRERDATEPPVSTTATTPLVDQVAELLESLPHPVTRVELRRRLRVNNQRLGQALADLDSRGVARRSQQGWLLSEDL
jgi:hypothetical protein